MVLLRDLEIMFLLFVLWNVCDIIHLWCEGQNAELVFVVKF